jgi:segregation and condensation protein B
MSDSANPDANTDQMVARIEALLFVAAGSVPPMQIATTLNLPVKTVEDYLEILESRFARPDNPRGLRLQRFQGRVQLTTSPEYAADIERFLGLETTSRLSRAALSSGGRPG